MTMFFRDYVVVDVETTGLDPKTDEIIEIAAVKVYAGEIVGQYSVLVQPDVKHDIPDFITELTGITGDMLTYMQSLHYLWRGFCAFVGHGNLVGHKVDFDLAFLNAAGRRYNGAEFIDRVLLVDDTKALWEKTYPGTSSKLVDVADMLKIKYDRPHRALNDCLCTHEVYQALRSAS